MQTLSGLATACVLRIAPPARSHLRDTPWHRADSQRLQRGAAWLDRVRSALTQEVKRAVAMNSSIHEAFPAVPSGQTSSADLTSLHLSRQNPASAVPSERPAGTLKTVAVRRRQPGRLGHLADVGPDEAEVVIQHTAEVGAADTDARHAAVAEE